MDAVLQKVILHTEQQFGRRLPPHHIGLLLAELPLALRGAVSMALRQRSTVHGRPPDWLDRATNVRLVDYRSEGEAILLFEAPRLGEAAGEVLAQGTLFSELRPDPDDSGFDLLADVLLDVEGRNADSPHVDPPLLRRIARFQRVFAHRSPFTSFDIFSRRYGDDRPARCTPSVAESASLLLGRTPAPRRVRIVGLLDGLEASTQRFSIRLAMSEKIVGVFAEDQIGMMRELWRKQVVVLGRAVFRASGRLLRVDADAVKPAVNEPVIFSQVPTPSPARLDSSRLRRFQGPRSGMGAVMGRWPGEESDTEIAAALERLS